MKRKFTPYNTNMIETDRNFRQLQVVIDNLVNNGIPTGKFIDISLNTGDTSIPVGFAITGWMIIDIDAAATVYRSIKESNVLWLKASAPCNVTIFVF